MVPLSIERVCASYTRNEFLQTVFRIELRELQQVTKMTAYSDCCRSTWPTEAPDVIQARDTWDTERVPVPALRKGGIFKAQAGISQEMGWLHIIPKGEDQGRGEKGSKE